MATNKYFPIQTNFTAGQLSPRLHGRVDINKYNNGLKTQKNAYSLPHGGVVRRGGFHYVARAGGFNTATITVTDAANIAVGTTLTITQIDGTTVTMTSTNSDPAGANEFSVGGSRTNDDVADNIAVGSGGVLGINNLTNLTAPNPSANLITVTDQSSGLGTLSIVSSDNTRITVVNPSQAKVRLVRFEYSVTQAYIIEFGNLYMRFYKDNGQILSGLSAVEVVTPYLTDELFDINFAQSADTLYISHPNHAPRKLTRTSHTSWTLATVTFTNKPVTFAGGTGDYPRSVTFFEERLYWAGSNNNPQTIWASKSGDFLNMDAGTGLDDESIEFTLATDDVNVIYWLKASDVLLIGTVGGEFKLHGNGNPVTPSNVRVVQETKYGSSKVSPITSGRAVIFNQRSSKKLRQMIFDLNVEGFVAPDLTILAEDITGDGITHMAYQQEPDSIVWAVREDGVLIGLTYQRDQQVVAWHQHPVGGYFGEATITVSDAANIAVGSTITITRSDGIVSTLTATNDDPTTALKFSVGGSRTNNDVADNIAVGSGGVLGINGLANLTAPNPSGAVITVTDQSLGTGRLSITTSDSTRLAVTNQAGAIVESVAVIPSSDGKSDQLWISVKKTVSGNTVRYIEYLDPSIFIDSGLSYTGSATSSFSGLDHLEGQVVQIVGDGAVYANKIVSSGSVTVSKAVTTAYIGLGYTSEIVTLPPEVPQQDGSSFGKKKGWNRIILNLYQTLGISVNGTQLVFRTGGDPMDSAPPVFTGQHDITNLGWKESDSSITIKQEQPLGMTLISLTGELNVND
jgi:hypothetical protein